VEHRVPPDFPAFRKDMAQAWGETERRATANERSAELEKIRVNDSANGFTKNVALAGRDLCDGAENGGSDSERVGGLSGSLSRNPKSHECDLPERAHYFYTLLPLSTETAFTTRLVRLAFDQEQPSGNKKKRYWVLWDANVVGGLDLQRQIASLR